MSALPFSSTKISPKKKRKVTVPADQRVLTTPAKVLALNEVDQLDDSDQEYSPGEHHSS